MKKFFPGIIRAMEIEAQEAPLVLLLLMQSVFLGIFYGIFDPVANSLFLSDYPAEMLPKAFTISGVVGILMTALYSKMQTRISFDRLAIINLSTIALFTIFLWLGFRITFSKWNSFLVLVMMGPLNILAMLGFWGTAGRLFSLRQGKRLFGVVDAGYIIGVIISSYAIPVLLTLHFKTENLLFISVIGVVLAVVFQIITTANYKGLGQKIEKTVYKSESSLWNLLKNKFVKLMAAFVILSMVTAFFVSYSFLAVTKTKYPESNDLTKFLGAFVGTVMFFTLMMKLFVYSKFMKTYGLKVSLILSPVLLILFTIAAAAIGTFGGFTATSKSFIFFFLIIALSRLFSLTLKSSLEAPSFKTLYQTIDLKIRHNVQSSVDGTINEIAALSSGLILLLMGLLSFIKLISFSQVLIVILLVWGWVALKLYKAYKYNLNESLSNIKSVESNETLTSSNSIILNALSGEEDFAKVLYMLNLQMIVQPIVYEKYIPLLLNHRLKEVRLYAFKRSANLRIYESVDALKNIESEEIRAESKKLAGKMASELSEGLKVEKFMALVRSKDSNERELAAKLAGEFGNDRFISQIKFLLRDFDNKVKISAIKSAAKLKNPLLLPLLIELLATDKFSPYASDALIEIGAVGIEILDNLFSKSENNIDLQLNIVRIMGCIGGEKACLNLVNKVNYHNIEIARLASSKLLVLKYQATEENFYLLHQALYQTMSLQAWNIAARASIRSIQTDKLVKRAIAEEIHKGFDHLFNLLALAYDAQSILHIRQHIESEKSESTGYAIELLELIVADDLKPMLFPIIDDSSDNEKIRQLQYCYPVDLVPLKDLLIDIIDRDFNYIGKWSKACSLNYFLSLDKFEISDDIAAQIFNSDELISELAACLIYKNNPEKFVLFLKRLDETTKSRLQTSIKYFKEAPGELLFNKILFLKGIKYFENLYGDRLIPLAKSLEEKKYAMGEEIEGLDSDLSLLVHFLITGTVSINQNQEILCQIGPNNLFGGIFSPQVPDGLPSFIALNDVNVYSMRQDSFNTIIYNCREFTNSLFSFSPIELV